MFVQAPTEVGYVEGVRMARTDKGFNEGTQLTISGRVCVGAGSGVGMTETDRSV